MDKGNMWYTSTFFHLLLFFSSHEKRKILSDLARWTSQQRKDVAVWKNLAWTIQNFPEYRNVFYYRIQQDPHWKNSVIFTLAVMLYPPVNTLCIMTPDIGEGLFIQHGFATIIGADTIGKNCHINQQVTIGYTDEIHRPTIGDNVTIYAGAKILGDVTIHDNVIIGANAVVVKDVPANCTVVGIPAYIVKKQGKRVKQKLS
jgi:serine O-acetyltransferase